MIMHDGNRAAIIEMPHIPNSNVLDAKKLYKYYWFAENIQYYKPYLVYIQLASGGVILNPFFAVMPLKYPTIDDYMAKCIKSPERALIRKSVKNGFVVKEIEYDDYICEIKEINTSKAERQGNGMTNDYLNPRLRDIVVKTLNPDIHTFGCFTQDEKLVGYYMFEKFTNFYHVVKGIAHSNYLSFGIMNHMFAYCVADLSRRNECQMLVYGTVDPDKHVGGLSKFKHNVGCQVKHLIYKGTRDDFRNLREFNKRFVLHDDSSLNYVNEYVLNFKN